MNSIVTIADKNYVLYAQRLFTSVRDAGWRGDCVLLTPDEDAYCNERRIVLQQSFDPGEQHCDCRWMLLDVIDQFKDGDKIMHMDADCIVTRDFPFEKLFKYNFSFTKKDNGDPESHPPYLKAIEQIHGDAPFEIISTPWTFRVDKRSKMFFRVMRLGAHASKLYNKGINVTLSVSYLAAQNKVDYFVPRDKIYYSIDMLHDRQKMKPAPKGVWLYHYGGQIGKDYWRKDYA
jgi:hypothetical protein